MLEKIPKANYGRKAIYVPIINAMKKGENWTAKTTLKAIAFCVAARKLDRGPVRREKTVYLTK